MSNYAASVVRIKEIRPHSNADRLVCTNIEGNNVIVGKETQPGDLGLFFPLEAQIGQEFAEKNDLIRRKDENGKPAGGMFDNNRRVRAQQFRGEKSMGFWISIKSLDNLERGFSEKVKEGDIIEDLGKYSISRKYVVKVPDHEAMGFRKRGRQPRESKIIPGQFHFHLDTEQLGRNIHKINPNDLVVLTWKLHGTSAIVSNCLTKRKMGFFDKLASIVGINVEKSHYEYIYASRRVIKNEFAETKQHFYGHDLWSEIGKEHFDGKLHTGESVYYEIVGYTKGGSYIQKDFDYGCAPMKQIIHVLPTTDDVLEGRYAKPIEQVSTPQHKVFVYRITMTAEDGTVTELQWNQVKARCNEIGVPHVPEIYYGVAGGIFTVDEPSGNWGDDVLDFLRAAYVHDQDSQFCANKVPEEGIVLRKEGLNIECYKLKSFRFLSMETGQLDKGETNIEDNG